MPTEALYILEVMYQREIRQFNFFFYSVPTLSAVPLFSSSCILARMASCLNNSSSISLQQQEDKLVTAMNHILLYTWLFSRISRVSPRENFHFNIYGYL